MNFKEFDNEAAAMGCLMNDWPELEPLTDTAGLPELPLKSIKELSGVEWFTDAVEGVSKAYNLPVEIAFCNAVCAVSTLTQGKFEVYTEQTRPIPANLYTAFIYPPSGGKSSVQSLLYKSLYDHERLLQDDWRERRQKAKAAKEEFSEKCPQIIAANCTPEAILQMVYNNNGRMSIISAEDSLFPLLTGLYNKNGSCQTDTFKKFFSGEYVSENRKSAEFTGTVKGLLSVCLGTQPKTFEGLKSSDILAGDGTLSRFLYFYPDPLPAIHHRDRQQLDNTILAEYFRTLNLLLQDVSEIRNIKLSAGAASIFWDYDFELRANIDQHDTLAPWFGRNAEQAARLAVNIHVIRYVQSYEIQAIPQELVADTMQAAIDIIRANEPHARRAYGLFSLDFKTALARRIVENLRGLMQFNAGDLYRERCRHWAGSPTKAMFDEALQLLTEYGYIRPAAQEAIAGRPPKIFDINPKQAH